MRPAPRPLLWRRLRWFLPYISGLTLACALAVPAGILWSESRGAKGQLQHELNQSDSVKISKYPLSSYEIHGFRWPR